MRYLKAGLVSDAAHAASLADKANREASFSVYKANNPADPDQAFLLVVCTDRIVTAHSSHATASTGQILRFSSI